MYRNDPILPVVAAGEPIEEDHPGQGIPSAAELLAELRDNGVPASMVWVTLESANHWLVGFCCAIGDHKLDDGRSYWWHTEHRSNGCPMERSSPACHLD